MEDGKRASILATSYGNQELVWKKKSSKVQEQEYEEDHTQFGKKTSRHGQGYRWWKQ